jgi:radical SAM superfamily enzyme YgiQ (UPF0313 family)
VLQRNISTDQIVEAFTEAHRHGIRTGSFNMIGLPRETLATVRETITLNKRLQPDRIMCTVYMPFHGTALGEDCIAAGWLEHPIDDAEIYYTNITIKHPIIPGRTLFGYQGFFDYYVRLPRAIYAPDVVQPPPVDSGGPGRYHKLRLQDEKVPAQPGILHDDAMRKIAPNGFRMMRTQEVQS